MEEILMVIVIQTKFSLAGSEGAINKVKQVVLQPFASPRAQRNKKRTLLKGVKLEQLQPYLTRAELDRLQEVASGDTVYIWGGRNTDIIRSRYDSITIGAEVFFYSRYSFRLKGNVSMKISNKPALANVLWGADGNEFENIYFVSKPVEINIPISELDTKIKPYAKELSIVRQLTVY